MTKTFDPAKPVQTRDGRKVRILAANIKGEDTIAAAISNPKTGAEEVYSYRPDGRFLAYDHDLDLANVSVTTERLYAIYTDRFGGGTGAPTSVAEYPLTDAASLNFFPGRKDPLVIITYDEAGFPVSARLA